MAEWGNQIFVTNWPITLEYGENGPAILRLAIERDGVPVEIIRNFDCDGHFITRDRQEHICQITGQMQEVEPEFLEIFEKSKICAHVCPYKKRALKRQLEVYGKWMKEKTRTLVQEYLKKENTIEEAKRNG